MVEANRTEIDRMTSRLAATIALLSLAWSPAIAEPFSVQGFSGGSATMEALPGVNFDPSTGRVASGGKCVERQNTYGFRADRNFRGSSTLTECNFGNFSVTTTSPQNDAMRPTQHNQFGMQPLPGWETWRP
jgi:hypothetical protein